MTEAEKRKALAEWEQFHKALLDDVSVSEETGAEKLARISRLEADPESWFAYYFPKYSKYPPARFHKAATRRLLDNARWYEVRAWSRGFAKSTRTMFEILYLALTGQIKNIILVSYSYDNAEKLLAPYRINLEANKRIANDYGIQAKPGAWQSGNFITRRGVAFYAAGSGQTPRGTKNEEIRPDTLIIDDIDTDEVTRNPTRVREAWEWIEQALIPTVDISEDYRILFCGNIIAKDCCITRAIEKADKADVINLVDAKDRSNWPDKVKAEDIAYIQSKISYISFQKEYMNNPLSQGTVFKEMRYGPVLPLRKYEALVTYTDPSFKESKKNDYKSTVLIGKYRSEFHVIRAFVEQTSTSNMVAWHYQIMDVVGEAACYYYMEANFLQDIILKEFQSQAESAGKVVPITGDTRSKPDKFTRIEALLEPLNREGQLILNEAEKSNPHMQRLAEQFLAFEAGSRAHDDGPDSVEGGVWILNNKLRRIAPPKVGKKTPNKKRY